MKKLLILLSVLVMIAFAASPVMALVGGDEDTVHTNVGAILFEWTVNGELITARACTATLIHPRVLVTASHCIRNLEEAGVGYDQLSISFDQDPLADGATHLAVEAMIPYPYFLGKANNGAYDLNIGLVFLASSVEGTSPATLPDEGYLEDVLGTLNGKEAQSMEMTIVGYGATELLPSPDMYFDAIRRVGNVTFKSLAPNGFSTDNRENSDIAMCSGDSGAPAFHDGQLVGVYRGAYPSTCVVDGYQMQAGTRLDTAEALSFINDTIDDYFLSK